MVRLGRKYGPAVVGDCTALPFPSGEFAGVWSCAMLQFVPTYGEKLQAVSEMRRVLAPGGKLGLIFSPKDYDFEYDTGKRKVPVRFFGVDMNRFLPELEKMFDLSLNETLEYPPDWIRLIGRKRD